MPLHCALNAARYDVEQARLSTAVAQADLTAATVRLEQARATPTPHPSAPTPTPPSPSQGEGCGGETPDPTRVRALVAGRVVEVRIVSVVGNEATVEIAVEVW